MGSISRSRRSFGEGDGNPLQYSYLENPMDRKPGWLQSMESQRIGQDLSTEQQQRNHSWGIFIRVYLIVKKKKLRKFSTSQKFFQFSSVQFSHSVVSDSATPWITARQTCLSITNSRSLLNLMPIESVMPSSHLILCDPLLLLPPIPPSIRVFSNQSTLLMRWSKYWNFSFSISPSNEHQDLFPLGWTGWISCSPRDSQESSPTPQFKSINFSALSFLHSPTLTSIHDHGKNHSLD